MTNLVFPICPSLQILDKIPMGLFPISKITGQPFIEENCQNSRSCNDIDVKLGPVTKIEKKNHGTIKKSLTMTLYRSLWRHCHFRFYHQLGAIQKFEFGLIVCKTYIFINSKVLSYKNLKQNYKISNTAPILMLWVKVLFFTKYPEKIPTIAKCWQKQKK